MMRIMFAPWRCTLNKTAFIPIGTNAVASVVPPMLGWRPVSLISTVTGASRLVMRLGGPFDVVVSGRLSLVRTARCVVVQHVLFLVKAFWLII
jgi:hypothetical protein